MTNSAKRVAVYARVSTNQQDCTNQLLELRRYCQARGWEAIEFVDSGFSGRLGEDKRPALKALMTAARRKEVAAVICWDFSRFARSLRQLVDAMESFRTWRISFISLREGIDTETANGRLMFGIFASLAEFEAALIKERVLLGLQKARSQGRVPGPKRSVVDMIALREMAAKGLSLRFLARNFGVGKDTIRRLLRQSVANLPSNLSTSPVGVPA